MGLLRAFLASELPSPLQDAIHTATADLRGHLSDGLVRWVPAHNVHLTLKFLGDVSPSSLELIKQMMVAEATQFSTFDVQVEGLGCYPSVRRPRVLWVGLRAPAELGSLQRAIEAAAARLGYESEERGFSPHLTIGRVRQNASSSDLHKIRISLEETRIGLLGTAHVDAVHLFKSELRPEGSIYTRLFSAPLRPA
ncbi:MAG TPA: RNA 2',3'-cyclic phosphodiesterase [Anaerolineales bacterium]